LVWASAIGGVTTNRKAAVLVALVIAFMIVLIIALLGVSFGFVENSGIIDILDAECTGVNRLSACDRGLTGMGAGGAIPKPGTFQEEAPRPNRSVIRFQPH
jgi:hypothetical protein